MKILLHICCGVCAAGVAERLIEEGHAVTGYFYNPNISPYDEYLKRLETARKVAGKIGFDIIEGGYDNKEWLKLTKGLEDIPEGGERCEVCFRMRLRNVYTYFQKGEYDLFTTTLTIGPMKNASIVNKIGEEIGSRTFLQADFKKKEGFKKAIALAKTWGLYRQNYCGCEVRGAMGEVRGDEE